MKLSSALQAKILKNPLNTILRSESQNSEQPLLKCKYEYSKKYDLPVNFSGNKTWGTYWTPVYNQGECGSCYAFATTSMLADRFNIQSAGKYYIQLSPTKMILCGKEFQNPDSEEIISKEIANTKQPYAEKIYSESELTIQEYACKGNTLYNALHYLYIFGVTTQDCLPYTENLDVDGKKFQDIKDISTNKSLPLCTHVTGEYADMCSDKTTPERLYRAYGIYIVPGVAKQNGSEETIQQEIYKWGPVVSAFKVYPNFYTFDPLKDIYKWDGKGEQVGGHAIEICGWGVAEDGTKYWEVANSWGEDWGNQGLFKMLRGINECEIEENVFAAIPDFFYPDGYIVDNDLINCVGKFVNLRKALDDNKDPKGEGIDPSTGYSYRVMDSMKLDFTRPVPLDQLPNRDEFVAGQLKPKNAKLSSIKVTNWVSKNKQTLLIIGGIVLIIAFIIIIIILLKSKKVEHRELPYTGVINNQYYH